MDTDPTITELKKLREGRGLRLDRLANSSEVLASLATTDPSDALDALRELVESMPDSQRLRALIVDFGWDLETLLGRQPTSREIDYLGDRRAGFAEVVGRDVKTLARWSDQAIKELRAHLIDEPFTGHVLVAAGVKDRRVTGIEIMKYEADDTDFTNGETTGHPNPEESSLPLVLFGFPRSWQPQTLRFVIAFLDENDRPKETWALVADSLLDVGFGKHRTQLEIEDGMARCRIDEPVFELLYGIWWEW